jgi:hypothetical protein
VRAITLYQPWASLIALGFKVHETRTWSTSYRGAMLIHAGMARSRELDRMTRSADAVLCQAGYPALPPDLPRGAVVAIADLVDCLRTEATQPRDDLDHAFGDWGARPLRLAAGGRPALEGAGPGAGEDGAVGAGRAAGRAGAGGAGRGGGDRVTKGG